MTREEADQILKGVEELRGNLPEDGLLVEEALDKERREQDRCKNCVNKNILVAQMKYYGFHAPDMTITEFAEDLFLDCKSKLCKAGTQMSLPECEDVPDINVGKMDDDELDEAIRHCEAMAERGKGYAHFEYICQERRQLASWLRELKRMRAQGTCDDAVSRDSVKYLLCKETCHPGPLCPDGFCKEICEKVDILPPVAPKRDGWILCSERLPEEPTEVMHELEMYSEYNVVIEGFTIPTTLCYVGDGEWRREESYYNVEKWQPLPKP
jgi:hypothetical protein